MPYIPKPGDHVQLEGVSDSLKIVSVDSVKQTAVVSVPSTPEGIYTVPWLKLSYLDESQNAARSPVG